MTTFINYRTGQKGTLVANFLNGGLAITSSTGASVNLPGTSAMKAWFYTDLFVHAEKLGIDMPNLPHSMIGWNKQRMWMEDDDVADFAYEGMLEAIKDVNVPFLCTHHLTMLKQRHIDDIKQRNYKIVGIKSDEQDAKNLDIEYLFKTVNRETLTDNQIKQLQTYAATNNIDLPPGRPIKEIDTLCIKHGFSPTDEHRVIVLKNMLMGTKRRTDWSQHDIIKINNSYENLSIPTVGYKQLFFYPFDGILNLKPDTDLGLWAQAVKQSWVPEKVNMFGETWYPAEYGYTVGE